MKCKICGANLKKEGDICKNCYNEYKEYEELSKCDEKEMLNIKMKFSIGYSIFKSIEPIMLILILVLASFNYYGNILGIISSIIGIFAYGFILYYYKKRAEGTQIIFYETKVKYVSKFLFVNKEEFIKYSDIDDIAFFKTFSQRLYKSGDLRIYTKGFLSGLTISDIPDIKINFEKICEIINSTR